MTAVLNKAFNLIFLSTAASITGPFYKKSVVSVYNV